MKKLLSLLSVLTISGTAIPTTISASPYQKQEKLNSNINYLQKNNLKNLIRNKRQEKNSNFPQKDFKGININNGVNNYFIQLCEFITYLRENDIIRTIRGQLSPNNNPISCGLDRHNTPHEDYFLNPNTVFNYFKIPIIIEENEQSKMIYLIFRSSDFYLQGFINNKNYYYFNDATISEITGSTSNNNLGFEGDYNNLMRVASGGGSQNPQITWEGIQDAFFQLSNMGTSHEQRTPIIASSLIRVILATAESLRFSQVQNLIINSVNNSGIPGTPVYWNNFIEIIKNWLKWTKEAIAYLLENGSLLNFPRITDILIFHSLISDNFKSCNSKKTRDLNNAGEYCVYLNEKKFYFNDNNENYEYFISYKGKLNNKAILKDFNIGKINPLDNYNNLRFFGENLKTHASWGNYEYDGGNALNYNTWLILLKDPNSKRSKVNNLDDINNIPKIQVQLVNDSNFLASLKIEQEIGFVLYKENDDYHLQIIISQYAETWASGVGGGLWIKLGNGIRLYNN